MGESASAGPISTTRPDADGGGEDVRARPRSAGRSRWRQAWGRTDVRETARNDGCLVRLRPGSGHRWDRARLPRPASRPAVSRSHSVERHRPAPSKPLVASSARMTRRAAARARPRSRHLTHRPSRDPTVGVSIGRGAPRRQRQCIGGRGCRSGDDRDRARRTEHGPNPRQESDTAQRLGECSSTTR